ncbi:helix-turn-helix domain-containing protein [Algoriphagus vanfongensis]|uniref:helix-turn-helix domain-containing protein n=1 Tax=Algoriphagus vanfongensis TaxID=426371 RepID=UPI0004092E1A
MRPVQKSRIPDNKAFVIRELIAPYFDVNWHFHSEFQLFVALKGKGTRFIGDHMQSFQEGDMVLTGPNLPHLWRNDNVYFDPEQDLETHGIVIYFPERFLNDSVFKLEEFSLISSMLHKASRGIEVMGKTNHKITQMMKKLLREEGIQSIILFLEILQQIAESSEIKFITDAAYINTHKESEKDRMGLVYDFVMHHFMEKISLKEVADICNLSESAFSRYFKSRANQSFSDFLSQVRINHAYKLLQEEQLNISQICYECGFFTLSNFNKQFKEKAGKTPMEYRREFFSRFD